MALTLGAQAQTHVTETGQNMLTVDEVKTKASSGTLYVALQLHCSTSQKYLNSSLRMSDNFSSAGGNTWEVVPLGNYYVLKRLSDGKYILDPNRNASTFTDDINSAQKFMPLAVTNFPNVGESNIASPYKGNDGIRWALAPNNTTWLNSNGANENTAVQVNSGTGNWTVWFTYEVAIKYNIVYKCYLEGESEPFQTVTSTDAYADGETVTVTDAMVPEFTGKTMTSHDASVTINGANAEVSVYYSEATTRNITYQVVDGNSSVLFTSEPVTVNDGTTISTLPAEYQKTLFYDYNGGGTVTEDNQVITFTATVKSTAPFIPSTAASPVWYFLTLSATPNYVTYTAGGAQNVTLPTTNADDETTHWAFIGNPYAGFTIVNEAAGTSFVLGSDVTTGSSGNGQNVYATLAAAGSQTNELWTVHASTYISGKNGFFLQNTEGHRLNKRNGTANVSYWTGGADAGSTFVATKVPGLAELILEAETLLSELTTGANDVQIGYPTASALSTFQQAIADAKTATDEAAGLATLKAAMAAVKSVANTNYTPRTDVYYTITSGRGSMIYEPTYTRTDDNDNSFVYHTGNNYGGDHVNVSFDANNANHQWGFIKKDGKYYMYNVGKVQFANVTQVTKEGGYQGANGDKHTWIFSNAPSSVTLDAGEGDWVPTPKVRVRATSEVTGKQYAMSISPSYHGPVIAYDAVNDPGIPMTFAVATATQDAAVTTAIEALLENLQPYRDALQGAITDANAIKTNENIGEGVGKYTLTGDMDALNAAITAAQAELAKAESEQTKESLQGAYNALQTAMSNITLAINLPQVGKFYRIKTAKAWSETNAEKFNNTQPYLIGENHATQINGTTRAAFSTTDGEDASSIWYLTTIGESPTQYLVNFSNGRPAVKNSDFLGVGKDAQFLSTHGTSIVFKAATNGEIGAYGIVFAAGTRALYTNVNLYTDAAGANGSGAGYNFELEEVTTLPVTMHDGQDGRYYATFSAPVAISSITGATAHKVKVENEKAKYSETGVEGIPGSTGVLLINETGDDAMLTIGDCTETIDTDLQHIFAAETSHEGLFFGLSTENKLGFFKLMEGGETTPTTGGFKAYLNAPASAKGVELVADNETTGIENMEHGTLNMENGAVYNLQGQRVNKAQKGVFIQNGKKVVLK